LVEAVLASTEPNASIRCETGKLEAAARGSD
jgi:hypothetical protein